MGSTPRQRVRHPLCTRYLGSVDLMIPDARWHYADPVAVSPLAHVAATIPGLPFLPHLSAELTECPFGFEQSMPRGSTIGRIQYPSPTCADRRADSDMRRATGETIPSTAGPSYEAISERASVSHSPERSSDLG
jgi:hypothetical protein